MRRLIACTLLILALGGFSPPVPPETDEGLHFPALQTTLVEPDADDGPLAVCANLDGKRQCDEGLAEAWCRKQGFAKFVTWSTAGENDPVACVKDQRRCAVVATITCARVPIVGD